MKKLQKEFEKLNECIMVGSEAAHLREKRDKLKSDIEEYLPAECEEYGISITKSELRFINQGSYKIGTTIKNAPGKSMDLDYAVIVPLDINEYKDPRGIKKAVKESLLIKNIRIPEIKEPCVTVAYHQNGEEYMHIDFPIYAEHNSKLYLARGKATSEKYEWEPADPEGLSEYFLDCFRDNNQLKRIVRYIKKWKQENYKNSTNSHEVPPSVGLTILACENYKEYTFDGDDDLSAFYYTLKSIRDRFSITYDGFGSIIKASINCNLPVNPWTDVFYKMRCSSTHMITFYNRLCVAVNNLQEAINIDDEHEAAKYVRKVVGNDFTIPEKKAASAFIRNKGEYSFG